MASSSNVVSTAERQVKGRTSVTFAKRLLSGKPVHDASPSSADTNEVQQDANNNDPPNIETSSSQVAKDISKVKYWLNYEVIQILELVKQKMANGFDERQTKLYRTLKDWEQHEQDFKERERKTGSITAMWTAMRPYVARNTICLVYDGEERTIEGHLDYLKTLPRDQRHDRNLYTEPKKVEVLGKRNR